MTPPAQSEVTLALVLVQLIVIILAARLAGSAAAALRQPRAVGEIAAGLLLGPSFFGHFAPELSGALFAPQANGPVGVLSQVGLILLMFQIGGDFEFGRLAANGARRAVLWVALASLGAPLLTGLAVGALSAPVLAPGLDPAAYALFVAVAMAITAVPILGRILREYGLTREEVGVIAISAAALNDVVGWFLLAGVAAAASAAFSPGAMAAQVGGLAAMVTGLWFIGRPAVAWLLARFPIADGAVPPPLMAIVLALIFVCGLATHRLGIFTIFGGFLFGLLFHQYDAFVDAWRRQVGAFVLVFFLPIFFTYTGLRTNVLGLTTATDWAWCAAIFAAASLSKVLPVYAAARLAGQDKAHGLVLGALMNTRALMELIVLHVGLSLGVLPQNVFTMLVIMAIGTTAMTGPLLQRLLPRAGYAGGPHGEA